MSERKRFEAWINAPLERDGEQYTSSHYSMLWQAWQAALSAPPGYALVPVEPTVAMAQALIDYSGEDELPWPTDVSPNYALAAYRIMIAAAPSAKEQTP